MIKRNVKNRTKHGKFIFITFLLLFIASISLIKYDIGYDNNENFVMDVENPLQISAIDGFINFTNNQIDGTTHSTSETITIEGWLHLGSTGIQGKDISLVIDGQIESSATDTTDFMGQFSLNYTITNDWNIYSGHNFTAVVTNPGVYTYLMENYFIIYFNTSSQFDLPFVDVSTPYLTGPIGFSEEITLNGQLEYVNGTGIPLNLYNNYWYSNTGTLIDSQGSLTDSFGSLTNINLPDTAFSNIKLKMNYSDAPRVNYSEIVIPNIRVFQDVAWANMVIPATGVQGSSYTISGQLASSTDPSLKINNRYVRVLYNGSILLDSQVQTNADGTFTSTFTLPMDRGNGTHSIQVELINTASKTISSSIYYISVNSPASTPASPGAPGGEIPFAVFFAVFIPILIGVIAALGIYGYYFLKKQKEESQVVSIPLEDKIKNLKILKDTGRLEESLSYLFNAIFMELVTAKFGREKKEFETIRDFAIVSVKELGLKATVVYPFMTKVESIIYNRPFKITDNDFYDACDIFSPVYFELTGHNFILNF